MAEQLDLVAEVDRGYPKGFFAWLRNNEHIYAAFERRALMMFNRGRKRYSARTIIEVMRWESDLHERSGTKAEPLFKLNDRHTPGMARYFIERHPECKGFFELREQKKRRL